jgi:YVTN family beta-propeller protein
VEFRILGPLEVHDVDGSVPLGPAKERALLAVLLLQASAVVSRERLIGELWGESPPPTAAKALNVHVSQLRKRLARNGDDLIVTRPPGYALIVDADRLDSARFERLVAEARDRVANGDLASARKLLREALSLWHGPALDGVELESVARNEVGRLDELRIAALTDRIDCDLALGMHEQVIGELAGLVAEHPLKERLRGQLILALYRAGRQADALQAYRDAREKLVGELGIEPSAALQRLEQAILNHDPALEAPAGLTRSGRPRPPPPTANSPTVAAPSRSPARLFRRRSPAYVAIVFVAGLLVAAAIVALHRGRHTARFDLAARSVAEIDAREVAVAGDIALSGTPVRVAAGNAGIWVANSAEGTVTRIDPSTRSVVRTIPVGNDVTDLVTTPNAVWALAAQDSELVRIDPSTDGIVARIHVLVRPNPIGFTSIQSAGLAVSQSFVYVNGLSTVWKVDERTNRVVGKFAGDGFSECALVDGALWTVDVRSISSGGSYQLQRRDLNTNNVTGTLDLNDDTVGVVATPAGVWAAETNGTILHLDPTDGSLIGSTEVGGRPTAIAVAGDSIWVADSAADRIVRVDSETGAVTDRTQLTAEPGDLVSDGTMLWLTLPYPATTAANAS